MKRARIGVLIAMMILLSLILLRFVYALATDESLPTAFYWCVAIAFLNIIVAVINLRFVRRKK